MVAPLIPIVYRSTGTRNCFRNGLDMAKHTKTRQPLNLWHHFVLTFSVALGVMIGVLALSYMAQDQRVVPTTDVPTCVGYSACVPSQSE